MCLSFLMYMLLNFLFHGFTLMKEDSECGAFICAIVNGVIFSFRLYKKRKSIVTDSDVQEKNNAN